MCKLLAQPYGLRFKWTSSPFEHVRRRDTARTARLAVPPISIWIDP